MHCAVSFAAYIHVVSRARQPACIHVHRSRSVVALTPSLPDTIRLLEPGTPRLAIQVVVQSSHCESWQHTQDSATTNKRYDKVLILGPPNMVSCKTERWEALGRLLPNNYTDQWTAGYLIMLVIPTQQHVSCRNQIFFLSNFHLLPLE